jgi:hypothetical protein
MLVSSFREISQAPLVSDVSLVSIIAIAVQTVDRLLPGFADAILLQQPTPIAIPTIAMTNPHPQ